MIQDGVSVIGYLTTAGRVSGKPHRVALRLVPYRGKLYASRRDAESDWCRNLARDPSVTVELQDSTLAATARVVDDEDLAANVSRLKYRDDRAKRARVVVEIVPEAG